MQNFDFSEVVVNGPSRVQRFDGYPDHWAQLDRVMIRAPEADIGDARPTAKALYESRLVSGKVSDHVPICWETFPDHLKSMIKKQDPTFGGE